ncbi:MAG: formyltransferase family protein [Candidatus Daviesbacteria bacterium]|nr:formyltransferase family protein [Candidatus Daviesbacteria bacterium]
MKKIAVLISNAGIGTNLQSIINGISDGKIKGEIVVVVSDKKGAYGLQRAKKNKLKTEICVKKEDLFRLLKRYAPDFICLTGWKQIILDTVIDEYPGRILNVHPGLIPDTTDGFVKNPDGTKALWNKGKFTEKAIQNFLDEKKTYAGSSITTLTHEFDFGPVITRGFVKIKPGDTVDSLYGRLKKKENKIYAKALIELCK